MTEDELSEALDWKGRPVKCRECDHQAINAMGLCAKGKACIRDRRARRVERFLQGNPELADQYLDHPYFEVRAGAARYANLFRLPPLLIDPEPEVRAMATLRLPEEKIRPMIRDEDVDVRIAAASRLKGRYLNAYMAEAFAGPVEPAPFHLWLADLAPPLIVDSWYAGDMRRAFSGKSSWAEVQGTSRAVLNGSASMRLAGRRSACRRRARRAACSTLPVAACCRWAISWFPTRIMSKC